MNHMQSGDESTEKSGKSMKLIDRMAKLGIPVGIPIMRYQTAATEEAVTIKFLIFFFSFVSLVFFGCL
jgi:putative effector of murein hydrolase LrgA (UPF0299 family)